MTYLKSNVLEREGRAVEELHDLYLLVFPQAHGRRDFRDSPARIGLPRKRGAPSRLDPTRKARACDPRGSFRARDRRLTFREGGVVAKAAILN